MKELEENKNDAIEISIKEQQELTLIGKVIRRRGLKLWEYNVKSRRLREIKPIPSDTLTLNENGQKTAQYKQVFDKDCIYFEALNLKNAKRRLKNKPLDQVPNLRQAPKEQKSNW